MSLTNLHDVYEEALDACSKYGKNDVVLPKHFKENVHDIYNEPIAFNDYTCIVTKRDQVIILPNQWIVLASFLIDLYKLLDEYKSKVLESISNDDIKSYKDNPSSDIDDLFKNVNDDEKSFLVKFITDYGWWGGSKSIDRGDFKNSSLLNAAGVIHDSHGYIPSLVSFLADNPTYIEEIQKYAISQSNTATNLNQKKEADKFIFNLILYGAPGSGKNHFLESQIDLSNSIKTTFHPDSDYSTFVGSFKPLMKEDKITYSFVPQSFTNAYVNAWKDLSTPYYLVIDEINRANCSQVFGDIFQLLDRKHNGYSKYTINVDKDLANYLKETLTDTDYLDKLKSAYPSESIGDDYSRIALPCNLYIYATMNTSDQSLFPMDSAFKRRWEWKYIPINYKDADTLIIEIGDQKYSWRTFLEKVNPIILQLKDSDDKQMGNRFVNPENSIISLRLFRSKVLFYLWSEVFKDEQDSPLNIFKKISKDDTTINIGFKDFFPEDDDENDTESAKMINEFMEANGI